MNKRPQYPGEGEGRQLNSRARRAQRQFIASPQAGFGGSFTKEKGEGDVPCVHCGTRLAEPHLPGLAKLERDRILPGSKGGSYTMPNLQPSCPTCNIQRSNDEKYQGIAQHSMLPGVGRARILTRRQFMGYNINSAQTGNAENLRGI